MTRPLVSESVKRWLDWAFRQQIVHRTVGCHRFKMLFYLLVQEGGDGDLLAG